MSLPNDVISVGEATSQAQDRLTEISVWIDDHNSGLDPMFALVMRTSR